jgi:hypothetical protein
MRAFLQGYMQKQAVSPAQMGTAVGAALGLGSGLVGNFLMAKMLGYDGDWKSYLLAGGMGGVIGAASVGSGVKHFQDNPEEFADLLERIEKSPRLEAWHKWQKQSPLMKPVRQGIGRVVTNVQEPVGYNTTAMSQLYKQHGLKGLVKAFREDKPLYTPTFTALPTPEMKARRHMYREYFDLPSRVGKEDVQDIFTSDPADPKTLRFNREGVGGSALATELDTKMREGRSGKHKALGGFVVHPDGSVRDPFDFSTSMSAEDRVKRGYTSTNLHNTGAPAAARARERILHHLRNIGDRAIGNPVTVVQDPTH